MAQPINKNQLKVLQFLVDLFKKLKVRYFLDDGLAAIIYGSKRKLYDIDLFIDSKDMNKVKDLFNDLSVKKFAYRKYENCELYMITSKINGVPIDICIDKKAFICQEYSKKKLCIPIKNNFKDVKSIKFHGLNIKVIEPEVLVVQKLFMNRRIDLIDARSIIKNNQLNRIKLIKLAKEYNVENKLKKWQKYL